MSIDNVNTTTSIGVAQDQILARIHAENSEAADDLLNDPDLQDPDASDLSSPPFKFDAEIQNQILAAMLQNREMLALASEAIKPNAFTERTHKTIAKIAIDFWTRYRDLPTADIMADELRVAVKDEKTKAAYIARLKISYELPHELLKYDYLRDQMAAFGKQAAFLRVYNKNLSDLAEGKCDISELKKRFCEDIEKIEALEVSEETLKALDAIQYFESADAVQRECWLEGWIMSHSLHLFVGSKKIGKSTLVHSLIPSLITGKPWFGKLATVPTHVLYLDYENPRDYVRDNLLAQMPRDQWHEVRDRFLAPNVLPVALTGEWLKQFLEHNKLTGKKVVIFVDSAYAAFNGLFVGLKRVWDNQGTDVRSAMKPLEEVARQYGAAIVVVHHDNKAGDTAGNAQWEAAVDYVWHYEAERNDRTLSPKWGRWTGPKPAELVFSKPDDHLLLSGTGKELRKEKQAEESEADLERLLAVVPEIALGEVQTEQNSIKQRGLNERWKMSVGKLSALISTGIERGLIERIRIGDGPYVTRPYYLCRRAGL